MKQPTNASLVAVDDAVAHMSVAASPGMFTEQIGAWGLAAPAPADGQKFLLAWDGDLTPSGVSVQDQVVAFAQDGMLADSTGRRFASYVRLMVFGGEKLTRHQMLITLDEPATKH